MTLIVRLAPIPEALLFVALFATLFAGGLACSTSGGSDSERTDSEGPLTQEAFLKLMTTSDIEDAADRSLTLTSTLRDLRGMAESVDPGQVVSIETWFGNTFVGEDGLAGLTFTVVDFESEVAAEEHYKKLFEGSPAPERMDLPIGDESSSLRADTAGIGSTLSFRSSDRVVTLHTTLPEGRPPLLQAEALADLARTVAGRLP